MKQTYEVHVTANAARTIKVRAASGREAVNIAVARIGDWSGPWSIQFPGGEDEHFSVRRTADGEWLGPNPVGDYGDEDGE